MDEERVMEESERRIREAQMQVDSGKINQFQQEQDMLVQEQERGMINEQLDLGELLNKIHCLLKGYVLQRKENGEMDWVAPKNNDMVILSEYGINYIMGAIQWYLNKNTLLSNYDDKQINAKMLDLATTITDNIFMEYDKMFLYPTLEECKKEIKDKIQRKVDMRKFAMELLGKKVDEKEIEKYFLDEMEDRIERELNIIKEQKIKNKLKRFESLIRFIQDTIHSTYQRAWKGQERTTLRQHTHISENRGLAPVIQQQGGFNPFGMFRKR